MGLFSFKSKKPSVPLPGGKRPNGSFVCPYCFARVRQEEVCFLVPHTNEQIYEESELQILEPDVQEQIRRKQKLTGKFVLRDGDEKLDAFWRDVGGRNAYANNPDVFSDELTWNSPLVEPQTAAEMTDHGYERDKDGFVCAVTDKLSHTRSEVRLCPECHNVLPEEYGKYPVFFIAIVGITSSGKTVYLTQLLGDIERTMSDVGVTVFFKDREAQKFRRIDDTGDILPNATTKDDLRPPITLTLKDKNRYMTMVLYDIAGENCVRADRMDRFGPYIQHADGVIVLIDPAQFPEIQAMIKARNPNVVGLTEDAANIYQILQTMNQNFLRDRMNAEGKAEVPFAFTVSKSDFLDQILRDDPAHAVYQILQKERVDTFEDKKTDHLVVNRGETIKIHRAVERLIRERGDSGLLKQIEDNFGRKSFFAVSALGCGTRWVLSNSQPLLGEYDNSFDPAFGTDQKILIPLAPFAEDSLKSREVLRALLRTRENSILCFDLRTGELERVSAAPDWTKKDCFYMEVDCEKKAVYELYFSEKSFCPEQGARMDFFMTPVESPRPRRIGEPLFFLLTALQIIPRDEQS